MKQTLTAPTDLQKALLLMMLPVVPMPYVGALSRFVSPQHNSVESALAWLVGATLFSMFAANFYRKQTRGFGSLALFLESR